MMCNIVLAKSWQLSLDILFLIAKPQCVECLELVWIDLTLHGMA